MDKAAAILIFLILIFALGFLAYTVFSVDYMQAFPNPYEAPFLGIFLNRTFRILILIAILLFLLACADVLVHAPGRAWVFPKFPEGAFAPKWRGKEEV